MSTSLLVLLFSSSEYSTFDEDKKGTHRWTQDGFIK